MSEKKKPKIGEGALGAYGRQGLAEIRGALYQGGNVAQPTDHGMWGNKTQGEIADDRRGRDQAQEQEPQREEDRESAREKLFAKYDSRVHEERDSERSEERDGDGPSMERD